MYLEKKDMKRGNHLAKLIRLWLLLLTASWLTSCDVYNFSGPQPSDRENLYSFPETLQGKWEILPWESDFDITVPAGGSGNNSFNGPPVKGLRAAVPLADDTIDYTISKEYLALYVHGTEKVVTGAWPKVDPVKGYIYPPGYAHEVQVMQTVEYDSLRKPVDTSAHYLVKRGKIYSFEGDRTLGKGYPFLTDKDTILIQKRDTLMIELGFNAFVRDIDNRFYVLNIRAGVLGSETDPDWWKVILLERRGKDSLVQYECHERSAELDCVVYDRSGKADYIYFDCNWTAADMMRLLKEGYFEVSGVYRRK